MRFNPEEITSVIRAELESFETSIDVAEVGTVLEVGDGAARIYGLENAAAGELLEFENDWGDRLQGSLYYPANYEPGRQYPMIVYIYEIRSNAVRSYNVPSERNYYNMQGWVQDGYFVWQPDIVYRDRDPGVSAVAAIVPSVQRVIETGMVDPDRVGLIGHSWGGYQTTFAVTQTDIFAAGVAGALLFVLRGRFAQIQFLQYASMRFLVCTHFLLPFVVFC